MRSKGVYYAILITMMLTLSGCDQLMADYFGHNKASIEGCKDGVGSKGGCSGGHGSGGGSAGKQFDDLNPFIKSIRERH